MLTFIELLAAGATVAVWVLLAVGLWPLALIVALGVGWGWMSTVDATDSTGADILSARLEAYALIVAVFLLIRGMVALARWRRRRIERRWEALVDRLGDLSPEPPSP